MEPRELVTHRCPFRGEAVTAHARPESLVLRPWSPGPACTSSNREVVVPEREDSRDGANEEAKDDVEAVMSKIEPTRAGDEDGGEERKNTDEKKIEGRRGSLTPSGCYVLCVRGEA